MKRIITLTLLVATASLLVASCGSRAKKAAAEAEAEQARLDSIAAVEQQKEEKAKITLASLPEEPLFDITTNYGTIRIKLYSKTPKHRENFAKLALTGYYDGLLFHRVINGFMIQGGDPLTKNPENKSKFGTGGPNYTVPAEFVPEYSHKKGALAAARKGDTANPLKASSGSQFYLVQDEAACERLNGQYTVFGETVDGLKTIDKIAEVETDAKDCPIADVIIISIKPVLE